MFLNSLCKFLFMLSISLFTYNTYAQQINTVTGFDKKQLLQEKIFVHTDKDFYVAGEILWFKLYDVDAGSLMPLNLSNIAYVEILNASQKPVLQATIALNSGAGNGSFYLTSSLASGNYIFRAYTNWMKNFDADIYFQKQITIVNTLTQLAKTVNKDSGNYDVGFFPEGGDLVEGIQSKIGFKATDKYGRGINCTGNIIDENNRKIISFSTLKFGMGSFYFTPEKGHTYTAVISINTKTITKPLPAIKTNGYVMHAEAFVHDQLPVTVSYNNVVAREIYLAAYNNKAKTGLWQATLNNGKATFNIDKKNLAAGITHLVVYNNNKQPVCERMIFIRPQPARLKLTADKETYGMRSAVSLNVAGNDNADLSMAVYLIDSLQTIDENNILNYLWLSSALKGKVESPEYYFVNAGNEADTALENLLLTQGWSRFSMADKPKPQQAFAPELEGHIIEGKVFDKASGLPGKNIRVYLSVPGKNFRFATDVSDDSGKVFFDIKDYYGSGELVVQTAKQDSIYRVEIADPFFSSTSGRLATPFNLSENKLQQLAQHNLVMQVQNAYSLNQLNRFSYPVIDSNAFYGKPDATYYLDNYVRFNTMEEVLREYIAGINVRQRQGNYSLASIDPGHHAVFDDNPLVLFDGVPVFDMNKVIAYNPLKIKKADVLNRKYYINSLIVYGIVSYSTYKGDLDGFQFDDGTIELSYDGLQLQREFYSPRYETDDVLHSRLPDYRNVLYWNPLVKTNNQYSFYTSDIKGKYIVVAQGINTKGEPGYATTGFEVK